MPSMSKKIKTKPLSDIHHEIGFAYKSVFTFLLPVSRFFPVQMWLFEDDKRLPDPSAVSHKEIRELGAGRYSFWKGTVYFSASDNSDPRINERQYTIHYIPNLFTRIVGLLPGRVWRLFIAFVDRLYLLIRRIWQLLIPQSVRHLVHSFHEWLERNGGYKGLPWELLYWYCFFFVILRGKMVQKPRLKVKTVNLNK